MKTLHLHDRLAEEFGGPYMLDVENPREALHALAMQLPGFADRIREGEWHIFNGEIGEGNDITEDDLDLSVGSVDDIHVMSAISGAGGGNGGVFSIILGIVAVVAAPFTGGLSMGFYAAGVGLIVGGLIQMSIKIPGADTTSSESADQRASFLFNGPKNTSVQGSTIPRGYGRCWSGSLVISAGLYAEEITT